MPEDTLLSSRLCAHLKVPLGTKWGAAPSRRNSTALSQASFPKHSPSSNRERLSAPDQNNKERRESDDITYKLETQKRKGPQGLPPQSNDTESML